MMPRRPMRPMTLVVDPPAEKPRTAFIHERKRRRRKAGRVIRRNASNRQCRLVHAVPGALLRPETPGAGVLAHRWPWERFEHLIAAAPLSRTRQRGAVAGRGAARGVSGVGGVVGGGGGGGWVGGWVGPQETRGVCRSVSNGMNAPTRNGIEVPK